MKTIISGVSLKIANTLDMESIPGIVANALRDSKIQITKRNCRNIGIFLGTTFSNAAIRRDNTERYRRGGVRVVNPADFPKCLISYLGGQVSKQFKIQGVNSTLSSGISSGMDAFIEGMYFVKRDKKNKAIIVELNEVISSDLTLYLKDCVCLIIEQGTNYTRKKNYADILGIGSSFEKEEENSGLVKAMRKILFKGALKMSDVNYVFNPGLPNTKEYILAEEAFKKCAGISWRNQLFSGKEKKENLLGLFLVVKILKDSSFYRRSVKKNNIAFFLNLGKNTNSSCLAIRIV